MSQSASIKLTAVENEFPWDLIILTSIWLVFAYVSVVFQHKTFRLVFQNAFLDVPMTPLLLFFASALILVADFVVVDKDSFGDALVASLFVSFLVSLPLPIAWLLLSFYEVSTMPSFLSVLVVPAIILTDELRTWSESRETKTAVKNVRGVAGMSKSLRIIGLYTSRLFFGYGTIVAVSYLYCYLTTQSFEVFARANPAVFLLGGATIMAGILALSRPSR